jgi:hypothetical protein
MRTHTCHYILFILPIYLRQDVLEKFRVGVALYTFKGRQLTSVTFPWFTKESELPVRVKVCVCVCMQICICICMYAYIHIYIRIYIHTNVHA